MTNTRYLAVECLSKIIRGEEIPKKALDNVSDALDRRDRAFLMEMVYGTLRFRDTLDWILGNFLKNPAKLGAVTVNNLRAGLYQILFMRVPDHAVIYEAVEIEKDGGKPSLVNAVLRNFLRKKDSYSLPLHFDDPVKYISINTSHPDWLVKRWVKRFGRDDALSLAQANNRIPDLTIRANTLHVTRDELINRLSEEGFRTEPTVHSPDGIRLPGVHSYKELSEFNGLFVVQDEASQLVSYLLGPQKGERVLDACAAPGGKTTHIAQIMSDEGEIVAVEPNPQRIHMLEQNIKSLGIKSARTLQADAAALADIGTFDKILIDAPCSSLGVIRKNPDVKYRHTPKSLLGFKKKQTGLLKAVSAFLKENGRLVYSVCSIEPEECDEVLSDFLKTSPEFRIIDAENTLTRSFTNNGVFRTYPHKHGMDGFFGVILCRQT